MTTWTRPQVLVIDNNNLQAHAGASRLRDAGLDIDVAEAHASASGLARVKQHDFRIVIVEPRVAPDGPAYVRFLRSATPATVIAWTRIPADKERADAEWKALESAGAYSLIDKHDLDRLADEVASILVR